MAHDTQGYRFSDWALNMKNRSLNAISCVTSNAAAMLFPRGRLALGERSVP